MCHTKLTFLPIYHYLVSCHYLSEDINFMCKFRLLIRTLTFLLLLLRRKYFTLIFAMSRRRRADVCCRREAHVHRASLRENGTDYQRATNNNNGSISMPKLR